MFSVKISFKGKNFLLGKGIDSFQKMLIEVNTRFPGECQHGAIFKYLDMELRSFDEVINIVTDKQLKSIKIEVQPLPQKIQPEQQEKHEEQLVVQEKEECKQQEPKQEVKILEKIEVPLQIAVVDEQAVIQAQQVNKKESQQDFQKVEKGEQNLLSLNHEEPEPQNQLFEKKKDNERHQEIIVEKKYQNQLDRMDQAYSIELPLLSSASLRESEIVNVEKQVQRQKISFSSEEQKQEQKEEQKQEQKQEQKEEQKQEQKQENKQEPKIKQDFSQLIEDPRFIQFIDRIVEEKLEKKMAELKSLIIKEQKPEQQEKFEKVEQIIEEKMIVKETKKDDIFTFLEEGQQENSSNFIVYVESQKSNQRKYVVDQEFTWNFSVYINSEKEVREDANLIDEKTGETLPITLRKGHQRIQIGPFRALKEGKFDKTFRMFYFAKGCQMQFFGPKFGFIADIENGFEKKRLRNKFRLHIDNLRRKLASSKSVDYIIQRLQELGINEKNFEDSKGFMEEILQAI